MNALRVTRRPFSWMFFGSGLHVFPDGGKLTCAFTNGRPIGCGLLCDSEVPEGEGVKKLRGRGVPWIEKETERKRRRERERGEGEEAGERERERGGVGGEAPPAIS